jgi:poly-beta-1,6-N-acetyl-D-glucosamine synthase
MNESRVYVLITPVKDEEALIGETIASVVGQSWLPLQWIIVSDGSKDRTDEIVRDASSRHPWIWLICLPPREKRSFAATVHAIETGVRALAVSDYQYIGLLDSDVRFDPNYFETLIQRFEENPRLGLGGGMVIDIGFSKSHSPRNLLDVP